MLPWVELVALFWFMNVTYFDSLRQVVNNLLDADNLHKRQPGNSQLTPFGLSNLQGFDSPWVKEIVYFLIIYFEEADRNPTILFYRLFLKHPLQRPGQYTPLISQQRDPIAFGIRIQLRTIPHNSICLTRTCLTTI